MRARPRFGLLIVLLCAGAANAYGQTTGAQGLHRVTWPGKNWSVDFSLAPFTVILEDSLRDEPGYIILANLNPDNPASGRLPRLIIQSGEAKDVGSASDIRDSAAKKLKKTEGVGATSVKTFEYKQIPALRYTDENVMAKMYSPHPGPPGTWKPSGRGMDAFFVKDGVLITFHLSAIAITKEDEQLFYQVLDSVRFTDTSAPSGSFDYLYKAKELIRQKQNAEATAHLNTALALERRQRQLDDANWRALILLLLDVHSTAGDRASTKTLLDYAVANDPTSPLFHLGLAYYYADQGEMDSTIAALEKAYAHRNNDRRTASWLWIDPLTHPAFEQFRKDEKFRKAAKRMKR
ncbi:MAG TPA: hypothetical protein VEY11_08915 [Pyrinomonadaceae bacterium]|nr:hypothetical protein [Pyrinomonadaceae bacterium]